MPDVPGIITKLRENAGWANAGLTQHRAVLLADAEAAVQAAIAAGADAIRRADALYDDDDPDLLALKKHWQAAAADTRTREIRERFQREADAQLGRNTDNANAMHYALDVLDEAFPVSDFDTKDEDNG